MLLSTEAEANIFLFYFRYIRIASYLYGGNFVNPFAPAAVPYGVTQIVVCRRSDLSNTSMYCISEISIFIHMNNQTETER